MSKEINFLPEDYIERKNRQRTNTLCLILFLVVMGGIACGFVVTEQQQRMVNKEAALVNAQAENFEESLKQLETLEKSKKQMTSKAETSASLISPVPQSLLLALVTNGLPEGTMLTRYDLETREIVISKPAEKKVKKVKASKKAGAKAVEPEIKKLRVDIEITGLAETDIEVSEYISHLQNSSLLSQVDLQYSKEYYDRETDRYFRDFKITMRLASNARASEAELASIRGQAERRSAEPVEVRKKSK